MDILGTVNDGISGGPVNYTLEYAPLGSDAFAPVPGGTGTASEAGGVLGRFDPTTLADGAYTLRLTATNPANETLVSVDEQTVKVAGKPSSWATSTSRSRT